MRSFRDKNGLEWEIVVNPTTIERLRNHELKIDLLECAVPDKAEALYSRLTDPITLTRVLYVLCKDQLAKQFGTDKSAEFYGERFGEGFWGDALDDGAAALDLAMIDFFPKARRAPMEAAAGKIREIERKAAERQTAMINHPRVDQAIEAKLDKAAADALKQLESELLPPSSGE